MCLLNSITNNIKKIYRFYNIVYSHVAGNWVITVPV